MTAKAAFLLSQQLRPISRWRNSNCKAAHRYFDIPQNQLYLAVQGSKYVSMKDSHQLWDVKLSPARTELCHFTLHGLPIR